MTDPNLKKLIIISGLYILRISREIKNELIIFMLSNSIIFLYLPD